MNDYVCVYLQGSLQGNSISYLTLLVKYVVKGMGQNVQTQDNHHAMEGQGWVWVLGTLLPSHGCGEQPLRQKSHVPS